MRTYQNLGVPVYRIIVPGMSEIYPFDDLVYNNTNNYIIYQEAILGLPDSEESQETYQDYLDELEQENIDDDALLPKILGVLPNPNSPWATLRFGELKCLIALAAEDYERALDFARWTVLFNQNVFDLERLRFYQCLTQYLEAKLNSTINLEDYRHALELVYSSTTLAHVEAHINHEEQFYGLSPSDLDLKNFTEHQELIKLYNLIKKANLPLPNRN